MSLLFGSEPLLFPSLAPAVGDVIRLAYGVLLLATLVAALPHARRYFLGERWGGYAQTGVLTDLVHNPVVLPLVLIVWFASGIALVIGRAAVAAALVNVLLCHYFFIQMRWRSVLRGMGAPGFLAYWLGAAVLLLEYTRGFAPDLQGLALLVLQVDFAFIMLSAGIYKFSAGYRHKSGMELGMVNPEWGYWTHVWSRHRPGSPWFRLLNELAWGTEVVAGLLMLHPPTRLVGALLILVSFAFIATQIRLGFLCEMVMVCCLLFAYPGSVLDGWLVGPQTVVAGVVSGPFPFINAGLEAGLWTYLALLPLARAGLLYNFYAAKALPGALQRALEAYTNLFGLILWRVFTADVTNFFIRIHEQRADGTTRLVSRWGEGLRYRQVAEAITVTSLFTTLKYYPSNHRLFTERLLRYARTVPHQRDGGLMFEYVGVVVRDDRFAFVTAAEYVVRPERGSVEERVIDGSVSVRAAAPGSPVREGVRPGSYVPLRN